MIEQIEQFLAVVSFNPDPGNIVLIAHVDMPWLTPSAASVLEKHDDHTFTVEHSDYGYGNFICRYPAACLFPLKDKDEE